MIEPRPVAQSMDVHNAHKMYQTMLDARGL